MKFEIKSLRIENLILGSIAFGLSIYYYAGINWWHYIALFALIDVIGYIPGRTWCILNKESVPPKLFYTLYNICHNLVFVSVVSLIYWFFIEKNLAILALFVHLFGDRGVFGNFNKEYGNPYHYSTLKLLNQEA